MICVQSDDSIFPFPNPTFPTHVHAIRINFDGYRSLERNTTMNHGFSFDVRNRRQFNNARLWSSPTALGPRAFFITASNPAHLSIDRLETKDEGIYRCRVDFRNSPTRKQKMNLTVIGEQRPSLVRNYARCRRELEESFFLPRKTRILYLIAIERY